MSASSLSKVAEDGITLADRLEHLLRAGADANSSADNGRTLLYLSCLQKEIHCVELLLRAKANPLLPSESGDYEYPLDVVDDEKVQGCILDFIPDINHTLLPRMETVLHRALRQNKDPKLIRNLIECKAEPSIKDKDGKAAFFYVRHYETARVLFNVKPTKPVTPQQNLDIAASKLYPSNDGHTHVSSTTASSASDNDATSSASATDTFSAASSPDESVESSGSLTQGNRANSQAGSNPGRRMRKRLLPEPEPAIAPENAEVRQRRVTPHDEGGGGGGGELLSEDEVEPVQEDAFVPIDEAHEFLNTGMRRRVTFSRDEGSDAGDKVNPSTRDGGHNLRSRDTASSRSGKLRSFKAGQFAPIEPTVSSKMPSYLQFYPSNVVASPGNMKVFKEESPHLWETCRSDLTIVDDKGRTFFHYLAESTSGEGSDVFLLIWMKSDEKERKWISKTLLRQDKQDQTALELAVTYGRNSLAEILFEKMDKVPLGGKNPLWVPAVQHKQYGLATRLFIAQGREKVRRMSNYSVIFTLLFTACCLVFVWASLAFLTKSQTQPWSRYLLAVEGTIFVGVVSVLLFA